MKKPTDTEIRTTGVRALIEALGDVQTEKFIAIIQREPFDYTKWKQKLWPSRTVEEISQAAMLQRLHCRFTVHLKIARLSILPAHVRKSQKVERSHLFIQRQIDLCGYLRIFQSCRSSFELDPLHILF
jgi:hypothetical protein